MNHSANLFAVKWRSSSNIAIIKYWGKHGRQLPVNPSLSLTLKNSYTDLELNFFQREENDPKIALRFLFQGMRNEKFEHRIAQYLSSIKNELPFIVQNRIEIQSENSFPHSSGIASSASSMSALALALTTAAYNLGYSVGEDYLFFRKASYLSRLASGSACRSVYGGWALWGRLASVPDSSDEYSIPLPFEVHHMFQNLQDAILITSTTPKKVSSSEGHYKMSEHPFNQARIGQAVKHATEILEILRNGDFNSFARITESEALSLHALMLSSEPGYFLVNEKTIKIIEKIRQFRDATHVNLCFTLDAGPNIHLLYPLEEKEKVKQFLYEELLSLCEGGKWIDDRAGEGPVKLAG